MGPDLPARHRQHRSNVPVLGIQPHSTHLSKNCLQALKTDIINGETEKTPLVVLLDDVLLSLNGDHRIHESYLQGKSNIQVAQYNLSNPADFRLIRDYETAHGLAPVYSDPESYIADLHRIIEFVRGTGIRTTEDFERGRKYFSSRDEVDLAYETLFREFLREKRMGK